MHAEADNSQANSTLSSKPFAFSKQDFGTFGAALLSLLWLKGEIEFLSLTINKR